MSEAKRALKNFTEKAFPAADPVEALNQELSNLLLPNDLLRLLGPPLEELGFSLTEAEAHDHSGRTLPYHGAKADGAHIALIHVADWIIADPRYSSRVGFLGTLVLLSGAVGLFIFSEVKEVPPAFKQLARIWRRQGLKKAEFFNFLDIEDLRSKKDIGGRKFSIELMLDLNQVFQHVPTPDHMADQDIARLVEILTTQLRTAPEGPKDFLRDLVSELSLPLYWDWSPKGGASSDARSLIHWALSKGEYPRSCNKPGYTVLGCLLEKLMKHVGDPDLGRLFETIVKYDLIKDDRAIKEIQNQYCLKAIG